MLLHFLLRLDGSTGQEIKSTNHKICYKRPELRKSMESLVLKKNRKIIKSGITALQLNKLHFKVDIFIEFNPQFMKEALKKYPEEALDIPPGISFVKICKEI